MLVLKMIYILSYLRVRDNILNWSSRERMSGREMVHIVRNSGLRRAIMNTIVKLRFL